MAEHKLETVEAIGVRADGTQQPLGPVAMPPKMKAREIVLDLFGQIDEESGDEGAMALWACEELIEWMAQQAAAQNGGANG